MTKARRARYTLAFKQEAVRLVESGQSIAAAARSEIGFRDQWRATMTVGRLHLRHATTAKPVAPQRV